MSDQDKFSYEVLENRFKNISTQTDVALAVSGGPDSMALFLLLDRWRGERLTRALVAPALTIFAVDHGFRSQARGECERVMNKAKELGHEGEILTWDGPQPQTRIQEMAREFRYQLLAGACHMRGIKVLMTAHHLDDQAETFLMRLARGSGVDGLAAMAAQSRRYGLELHRPLLDFEKTDLLSLLENSGWDYVNDPSNKDSRFERVRLRKGKEMLEKLGLTSQMVGLAARRLRRAKIALNETSDQFIAKNAFLSDYGTARIDQLALSDAPDEIALRVLSKLLRVCGGSQDFSNMARLEKLTARLREDFSTNRTLAGCRVIAKGDFWLITREAGRITELEKPIVPDGCMFWDNRYIVCADQSASPKIMVCPLSKTSEFKNRQLEQELGPNLQSVPREARASLLTLCHKNTIIAVPALDFWRSEAIKAGLQARLITGDDSLV